MKWDWGPETRAVARLNYGFNRSGRQLSDGAIILFSNSLSQAVPFDPTLSRPIKPCATWVVHSRPIDKFGGLEVGLDSYADLEAPEIRVTST